MYRIAVCDDSPEDAAYVVSLTKNWNREAEISVFSSAEAFMFSFSAGAAFDIVLLDVEMGKMNGVEAARRIREVSETVQLIFVTGYSDYIAQGYDVAALQYLLKPADPQKLSAALDRAASRLARDDRCLLLETSDGIQRVPVREIVWIEVSKNYATVHAKGDFVVRRTLDDLEKELDDRRFFRAGRSFIVNLADVRSVTKTEVKMTDGSDVPLPRGMYEPLNRAIIERF